MVVFFETSFVAVASEESHPLTQLTVHSMDVTLSPLTGSLRRVASQNKLKTSSPATLIAPEGGDAGDRMKRVASNSSISSLGEQSGKVTRMEFTTQIKTVALA
jgi:hypothetical protein